MTDKVAEEVIEEARITALLEGLDDYVGTWEIVSSIRWGSPSEIERAEVKRAAILIIRSVLEDGLMHPVTFRRGRGWRVLEGSTESRISSIEREWDLHESENQSAKIIEITFPIWFILTEKGEAYARRLDEQEPCEVDMED